MVHLGLLATGAGPAHHRRLLLPLFIGRSWTQRDHTRRRWPRGGHPLPLAPYKVAPSPLRNPSPPFSPRSSLSLLISSMPGHNRRRAAIVFMVDVHHEPQREDQEVGTSVLDT